MSNVQPKHGMANAVWLFALSQLLLITGIGVTAVYSLPTEPVKLPAFQNEPRNVVLKYDWPQVITDEQLTATITKLRPQLRQPRPKINYVDHALRCWGVSATFEDPNCLSGAEMLAMLTDQNAFQETWGGETAPLLLEGEFGPGFRTRDGNATSSHVDHTLGTLAEIGITLDAPIVLGKDSQNYTVRDLLEAAMLDFRINQQEYEWTTVAAASYSTGPTSWISQDGEQVTFDILARRLMRQHWNEGVCYGNHRLYSLAMLLQFDDQVGLFQNKETRGLIVAHLNEATTRLIRSQSAEGYWDQNWPDASIPAREAEFGDVTMRRTLATGHALEWWAIAPAEVLPPREVIVRAAQWLVVEVDQMEPKSVDENFTFLTHVCRALCLWRGKFPHELTPLASPSTGAEG
ncbi:hypothetical protein [Bremerella cremea]|uniref:hypothetical protein n=1 Tax=Bremerella cremea TaxID=1031537 RepID=UPI0031ECF2C6